MFYYLSDFLFFFFQAEDGIRDDLVTGVRRVLFRSLRHRNVQSLKDGAILANSGHFDVEVDVASLRDLAINETEIREHMRSEERRVGKECRSRWSTYH